LYLYFYFQNVPKIFSAGLDILEMYQPNVERLQLFWRSLQDMWLQLYTSPLATIAAINVRFIGWNQVILIGSFFKHTPVSFTFNKWLKNPYKVHFKVTWPKSHMRYCHHFAPLSLSANFYISIFLSETTMQVETNFVGMFIG
jgi:hypothetical protein